jgi:hypothetical protein
MWGKKVVGLFADFIGLSANDVFIRLETCCRGQKWAAHAALAPTAKQGANRPFAFGTSAIDRRKSSSK